MLRWRAPCCALSLLAGGCANFDVAEYTDLTQIVPESVTFQCSPADEKSFLQPFQFHRATAGAVVEGLPDRLRDTAVMGAVPKVFGSLASSAEGATKSADPREYQGAKPPPDIEISVREMKAFAEVFAETLATGGTFTGVLDPGPVEKSGGDPSLATLFKKYYWRYVQGKYVTRHGKKLAKPEVRDSLGNEALTGIVVVFLEALHDHYLRTPVVQADKTYYPGVNSNKPTGVDLGYVTVVPVATNSKTCGITKREAAAIAFLSSLAGEKSAILSGLTVEAFGGLEASFVIGGHFSVGDNQTLAELSKAFFEALSRRTVERGAYDFFWRFAYATETEPGEKAAGADAVRLVHYAPEKTDRRAPEARKLNDVARFLEDFN